MNHNHKVLKQEILDLLESNSPLSASAILLRLKGFNQNLSLTAKKVGSSCGEMVREGLLIKEHRIPNHYYGFYTPMTVWMEKLITWIKDKIPFELPHIETEIVVEKKNNILSGRTRFSVGKITITLFISKNILAKRNIAQGIKCVIVHEFCHVVNLHNPDLVMQTYFPEILVIWDKAQKIKAIECSTNYMRPTSRQQGKIDYILGN